MNSKRVLTFEIIQKYHPGAFCEMQGGYSQNQTQAIKKKLPLETVETRTFTLQLIYIYNNNKKEFSNITHRKCSAIWATRWEKQTLSKKNKKKRVQLACPGKLVCCLQQVAIRLPSGQIYPPFWSDPPLLFV